MIFVAINLIDFSEWIRIGNYKVHFLQVISLPKCQENRKGWILDRRFREGLKNKRLVLEETSHIEEFGTSLLPDSILLRMDHSIHSTTPDALPGGDGLG